MLTFHKQSVTWYAAERGEGRSILLHSVSESTGTKTDRLKEI